jgi:hypothetical protein
MDTVLLKYTVALVVAVMCSALVIVGFTCDSTSFRLLWFLSTVYFGVDFVFAPKIDFRIHHLAICSMNISRLFIDYEPFVEHYIAEWLLTMEFSSIPLTLMHIMNHIFRKYRIRNPWTKRIMISLQISFVVSFLIFRIAVCVFSFMDSQFWTIIENEKNIIYTVGIITLNALNVYWLNEIWIKYSETFNSKRTT